MMNDDVGERQVQRGLDRDAVAVAVVHLAETCEPDGQADPAEDGRPEALVLALADLLGNINSRDAAEGIQQALWEVYAHWTIGS
ncbi:MAG: hypothetical protein H0X24_12590 [Ktedonobacterales bacterium]|nr:hypothetical protein [Ktedonobacterales bacterium]